MLTDARCAGPTGECGVAELFGSAPETALPASAGARDLTGCDHGEARSTGNRSPDGNVDAWPLASGARIPETAASGRYQGS